MLTSKRSTLVLISYLIIISLLAINHDYTMLSTILTIGIGVATFFAYKAYRKNTKFKMYCLILTFSIFSYFLGSSINIFSQNNLGFILYSICSLGLSISIYYLIYTLSTKRDLIYILLNVFTLSIFIVYIAWYLFFKRIINYTGSWNSTSYIYIIFIFNAFLLSLGILILFQLYRFTTCINFLTLGTQIYAATEIICYYLLLNHIVTNLNYTFILFINLGWTFGLLFAGYFTFYITDNITDYHISKTDIIGNHSNIPTNTIIFILFLISVVTSPHILITLLFISVLVFRQACIRFMNTYWENEKLNKDYMIINETLSKTLKEISSKNDELYYLANIDPLTSLPNRRNFVDYLDNLIMENNFSNTFALLFLDLDRFKSINDWYGHDMGDKLLVATSERLKDNLDTSDFVARQGGDEFVVILNNLTGEHDILEKSSKLVDAFRQPFIIDNIHINSTISIGISIYPLHSINRSDLMKFSDIALYNSKKLGKNTLSLYNDTMKKESIRKLELESKLYDSIANNELCVYFQPQIDANTEELMGVEALVRWNNPDLGFVSPSEFIPIAEDNGFIINIGDWVLDNACKKIKYLNKTYNKNIKVGINVSPKQFITSNLDYSIHNCIDKYNLDPHWIDIEITENCVIQNEKKTYEKLLSLKELGVQISIDDFGTGYSSFIYLKKYPLNTIKIALELITDINSNKENYNIVKAIISMCKDLHLNVIAEGVETKDQLDTLKNLGCKQIQGYYFDKPMTFNELEDKYFKI